MHAVADAIRQITARMQWALDSGERSRAIDANDLIDVLLAIADTIDDPFPEPADVPPREAPPGP